jgi:hypothetical protein
MTTYRPRYRHWYRPAGGSVPKPVIIAGAAVLALGAAGTATHAPPHHHHARAVSIPAAPSAIAWSRAAWAQAFLRRIPEPVTICNLSAVVAWETREGGGYGNQASFDPLNVNPGPGTPWPGHPAIGAWAFPDAAAGLAYTVRTIRNGYYGGILAALHAGDSAQAVLNAVMASPWAQSHYSGTLEASC